MANSGTKERRMFLQSQTGLKENAKTEQISNGSVGDGIDGIIFYMHPT